MNQPLTKTISKTNPSPLRRVPDSFVEALKNTTGQSTTPQTADTFPWQKQLEEERRLRLEQQQTFETRRRQEHLVFSQKELGRQQQIQALQDQLKQLIKEVSGLSQEVDIAVTQQIVNPGTYHISFFDKLRQLIQLMRKKIHDSQTWLAAFNGRTQAKSGYWGQVQSHGTKFMLSHERYMVTQTG